MISKKDSRPLALKFQFGIAKTNKLETIYGDRWYGVYGLVSDPTGSIQNLVYGTDYNFDKIVTFNAGEITRKIDYTTRFCVDNVPTDIFEDGDYEVKYIFPELNGEIRVGLVKKKGVNIPKLYFKNTWITDSYKYAYIQVNLDKKNSCAYIGRQDVLPFMANDYVWFLEPKEDNLAKNRYKFIGRENYGITDGYKQFSKLTFAKE